MESEECQGDPCAMVIHLEKQERQRRLLLPIECPHELSASQDEQGAM